MHAKEEWFIKSFSIPLFISTFDHKKERWAQRIKLEQAAIFPAADMKGNRGKCIAHELGTHESMVILFSLSGSTGLAVEERLQTDYSLQEHWRLIAHLDSQREEIFTGQLVTCSSFPKWHITHLDTNSGHWRKLQAAWDSLNWLPAETLPCNQQDEH